jgi:hypothetical protein
VSITVNAVSLVRYADGDQRGVLEHIGVVACMKGVAVENMGIW